MEWFPLTMPNHPSPKCSDLSMVEQGAVWWYDNLERRIWALSCAIIDSSEAIQQNEGVGRGGYVEVTPMTLRKGTKLLEGLRQACAGLRDTDDQHYSVMLRNGSVLHLRLGVTTSVYLVSTRVEGNPNIAQIFLSAHTGFCGVPLATSTLAPFVATLREGPSLRCK